MGDPEALGREDQECTRSLSLDVEGKDGELR